MLNKANFEEMMGGNANRRRMRNGGEALNFDRLFRALIQVESGGIPDRVSPAGAIGLTQIMPETAMKPGYGVDDIFTIARKMNVPFAEESLSGLL